MSKEKNQKEDKKKEKIMTEFDIKFSKRLIEIRKEYCKQNGKKLTQQEISEDMGLGTNTLSSYETGSKTPRIQQLIKIKNYYNVPFEYLLCETDDKNYNNDEQAKKNKKAINDIKKILIDLQKQN